MDILTGLLLVGVVISITLVVVRELFDESFSELKASYFRDTPNPIENSFIGMQGKVIEIPAGEESRARVRIGREIWSARFVSADTKINVGEKVRVIAIDGMILDIEAAEDTEETDPA